jgi:hypothetical protein
MDDDNDFDLKPNQWEALKALRTPSTRLSTSTRLALHDLVGLGLVAMDDRLPVMTEKGRKALIRGSFRLLDAAA